MNCVRCGSNRFIKNAHIRPNKQRLRCKECGRQWVENPSKRVISEDICQIIDNLFLERVSQSDAVRLSN